MDTLPTVPTARFDSRDLSVSNRRPHWILLTAHRAGTTEAVTVEMGYDQWFFLAPVQYVIKLELSRQQPRVPRAVTGNSAATIPRGHIEWKDGQNWVVITAYLAGTEEPATVEMTLGQWFGLKPVRAAVADRLDNWHDRKMPTW